MIPSEPTGALSPAQIDETAAAIAAVQQPDGAIPWYRGSYVDPWDHIEAAMALDVAGRHAEAEQAYEWLAATQQPCGTWASAYRDGLIEDPTFNTNFTAYIATGVWHHFLATDDGAFLEAFWPVVEGAIDAVLDLQAPTGEIWWARDQRGRVWPGALLTSSACVHLSLRCAVAIAERLHHERPDWELSAGLLRHALAQLPQAFEPRDRYSMDWYYPILGGALSGDAGRARIDERWDTFVVDGLGARCVSDRPWVTTAETCELILALDALGRHDDAALLLGWIQTLRGPGGAYWTGYVYPDDAFWPVEQPTWTSGAVLLAADALARQSPTNGLFRGEGLPWGLDPADAVGERA